MKIVSFLFGLILFACTATAQSTSPRWTTGDAFTSYNNGKISKVATTDTTELRPQYYNNVYNITLTDSITDAALRLKSLAGCFFDDRLILNLIAPQADTVELVGHWKVATGTTSIAIDSAKITTIFFWFDGAYWVEYGRNTSH